MSIGKPPSHLNPGQKLPEHASKLSTRVQPQYGSLESPLLQSQIPHGLSSAHLPKEFETWSHFKEDNMFILGTPAAVGSDDINERIEETRRAQVSVTSAISALERRIENDSSTDPRKEEEQNIDFKLMRNLIDGKTVLDETLVSLNRMSPGSGPSQPRCSDETELDDSTLKVIAGLDKDDDQVFAERQRNHQRRRRPGLVDGVKILDDYTLATIHDFNRQTTNRV